MRSLSDILYALQALFKHPLPCPYCGGDSDRKGTKYVVVDIMQCRCCHLWFVNPQYHPPGGLQRFYDVVYESDATELPDTMKLSLLKGRCFAGSNKDFNARLAVLRRLTGGGPLLEFGSSWGYFLYQARQHGFEPIGVEVSRRRAAFGREALGVSILHSLDDAGSQSFRTVYTAHVLEHLPSLRGIFESFSRLLMPDGHLLIEVPNFDPSVRVAGVFSTIGKVHPLGFSRDFFDAVLPRHGFAIRAVVGSYDDLERGALYSRDSGSLIVHAVRSSCGA